MNASAFVISGPRLHGPVRPDPAVDGRTLVLRPASVSELAAPLAMSMSAVVQHLKVLEASGLVVSQKVGRVRTCEIQPQVLSAAERWLNDRRHTADRRLDRLGALLDAELEPETPT